MIKIVAYFSCGFAFLFVLGVFGFWLYAASQSSEPMTNTSFVLLFQAIVFVAAAAGLYAFHLEQEKNKLAEQRRRDRGC